MKTKPIFLVAAVVLLAAAGALYFQAAAEQRAAVAGLATLTAENTRLETDVRAAQARIAEAGRNHDEIQAALETVRAAKTPAPAVSKPAPAAGAVSAISPRDVLAKDSELQVLWLRAGRARAAQDYGPLFTALQLTPAQKESFLANVLKRQEQLMDLAGIAQSQGGDNQQAIAALQKTANDEFQAAQAGLLGADGVRRWQEFDRAAPLRMMLDGFAGTAALEGVPVSAPQSEQLARALGSVIPGSDHGGRIDLNAIDWTAVDAEAQRVLTARQLELFKTVSPLSTGVSRWNLQLEATVARAMQAEREAAGKTAPVPGT
jgi:hypothetical protein